MSGSPNISYTALHIDAPTAMDDCLQATTLTCMCITYIVMATYVDVKYQSNLVIEEASTIFFDNALILAAVDIRKR